MLPILELWVSEQILNSLRTANGSHEATARERAISTASCLLEAG